ncbi:MAG: hypothetical protein J0647_05175 [Campylobacteraceae bacterium]|nr:hypothetical protein [Campylobacteraceae bacterium]
MKSTLANLIKKEYLKSIIVPLLLIETMLLIAYFWSNSFVTEATKNTLIAETKVNIKEISLRSATIINNDLKSISRTTALFQNQHENFFKEYNPLRIRPKDNAYTMTDSGVITNTQKNEQSCTLFFSNILKNDPNRLSKAMASEQLDYFYNATLKSNENIAQVYFNSFDSMNRLCPYMVDALEQYPHDMDIPTFNFYFLADSVHNPERKVVWTEAYLDPAGLGWMISAIAPVYKNDFLEGVVGIDVTIENLINNMLSIKLPYKSSSMLLDKDGNILAMSKDLEPILGLKELTSHEYNAPVEATISKPKDFNIFENNNSLSRHLSSMVEKKSDLSEFQDAHLQMLITQNTIEETGWKLILLLDKNSLLASTIALKEKTNYIGYVALALMGVFYVVFILVILERSRSFSKRILTPLSSLIKATNELKGKMSIRKLEHSDIIEIDTLLDNFTSMGMELQGLYESMERKIKDGVLENIETQKVMIYQSRLAQMGEMISMIAHQWRQPLGSISTVTAGIKLKQSLKKFDLETVEGRAEQVEFLNTAIGKIENYIQFLTTTIDDFRNFFKPEQNQEKTTLQLVIDGALKLIGKSLEVNRIILHVSNNSHKELLTYDKKVIQVLINILKNAQDAILERKVVLSGYEHVKR